MRVNPHRRGLRATLAVALAASAWLGSGLPAAGTAQATVAEVERLLDDGRAEQAVPVARALLSSAELRPGRDSLEAAHAAQLLAEALAYASLGSLEEQVRLSARAVDAKRRLLADDDPQLARAYRVAGMVHNLAGRPAAALPHFEQSLRIAERRHAADDPELEIHLRLFGVALYGSERYREAKTIFGRLHALCLAKYGAHDPGMIKATYNLAITHRALGEFDEAERRYGEALAILEAQPKLDVEHYTWTLNAHANLLASRGRLREALEQSQRVLALRREHYGDASEAVAWTLNDLANMQRLLGDYEGARAHLEESLRIQEALQVSPTLAIKTRINLARLQRLLGQPRRSRELFEEVATRLGEGEGSVRGIFHAEFATLLAEIGEPEQARRQYEAALAAWRDSVGEGSFHDGLALAGLARLDVAGGRLDAARERLERARAIFEASVGSRHPRTVETLGLLAAAHHAAGRPGPALETALAADEAARASTAALLAYLPERQALAHAAVHRRGRDVAVSLALADDAPAATRSSAYDAIVRSRAIVFDEIAARHRFYGATSDSELAGLARQLDKARTRLANLFVLEVDERAALDEARREIERLETELARGSAEFRARRDGRAFDGAALAGRLPQGTVCLSFLRYERHGAEAEPRAAYAAVVQRAGDAAPEFVDLGPAAELERAVADWRSMLLQSESSYRTAATALRRLVWDPLAERIGQAPVVYIVPDGVVQLVSFAALPVEPDGYLLERGPAFHYLTAERDLAPRGGERPGARGLLIVGGPAFDVPQAAGLSALPGRRIQAFAPLPGARAEADEVDAIWRERQGEEAEKTTLLVDGAASEAAFREQAPGKRVLHLATHGFFLDDARPAAAGSRAVGGLRPLGPTAVPAAAVALSPLLRSGLAFAGANRPPAGDGGGNDGILTAEEVSALGLSGVELAVLSACRTGAGSVSEGEGVFGLRRAFLTAGVRTVLTNLWDVEDLAAREWIAGFYRHRLSGNSIPESVRVASLAVLEARRRAKQGTHPFFWGGWLAVGAAQ